jgi:hypothetical protein
VSVPSSEIVELGRTDKVQRADMNSTVGGTQKGDIVKELMKTCYDNGTSRPCCLLAESDVTCVERS